MSSPAPDARLVHVEIVDGRPFKGGINGNQPGRRNYGVGTGSGPRSHDCRIRETKAADERRRTAGTPGQGTARARQPARCRHLAERRRAAPHGRGSVCEAVSARFLRNEKRFCSKSQKSCRMRPSSSAILLAQKRAFHRAADEQTLKFWLLSQILLKLPRAYKQRAPDSSAGTRVRAGKGLEMASKGHRRKHPSGGCGGNPPGPAA